MSLIFTSPAVWQGVLDTPLIGVWDISLMDINSYTISNSGRTATFSSGSGPYNAVISRTSQTSGKYYFEILAVTLTKFGTNYLPGIGVGYSHGGDGCRQKGNHLDSRSYYLKGAAGVSGVALPEVNNGDTVMIAFDIEAGKAWYGLNGTWGFSGDPTAGTNPSRSDLTDNSGGVWYAGFGGPEPYAEVVTSRFLTSQQIYSKPVGFSEWG